MGEKQISLLTYPRNLFLPGLNFNKNIRVKRNSTNSEEMLGLAKRYEHLKNKLLINRTAMSNTIEAYVNLNGMKMRFERICKTLPLALCQVVSYQVNSHRAMNVIDTPVLA